MNPDEKSAVQSIYTGSGGANIGKSALFSTRASYPFAKITIWQDSVEVSVRLKKIKLTKTDIDRIVPYNFLLSHGIQVVHHHTELSPFVVFFSRDMNNTISAFKQAGYPVDI